MAWVTSACGGNYPPLAADSVNVRWGRAALVAAMVAATTACSSGSASSSADGHSGSVARSPRPATASAQVGDLRITGGYIPEPASPDVAAAYFTVTNTGSAPDSLVRVTTAVAGSVMAMTESDNNGVGSMQDLSHVAIPAHGNFRFTPGHAHLMLDKPTRALRQDDRVMMTITFAKAGTVRVRFPIVGLTGPTSAPA